MTVTERAAYFIVVKKLFSLFLNFMLRRSIW